jgi:hypothetical protein
MELYFRSVQLRILTTTNFLYCFFFNLDLNYHHLSAGQGW